MRIFGITVLALVLAGCSRQVEVKTGTQIVCEKCDKVIENNIETKLVASADAEKYMVEKIKELCDDCKPPVEWRVWRDNYGVSKFSPFCPHCKNTEVGIGATTCRGCGKEFRWKSGVCTECNGAGKFKCEYCKGEGQINSSCHICGGTGKDIAYGKVYKCALCKGKGFKRMTCGGCFGGKVGCIPCNGKGTVG